MKSQAQNAQRLIKVLAAKTSLSQLAFAVSVFTLFLAVLTAYYQFFWSSAKLSATFSNPRFTLDVHYDDSAKGHSIDKINVSFTIILANSGNQPVIVDHMHVWLVHASVASSCTDELANSISNIGYELDDFSNGVRSHLAPIQIEGGKLVYREVASAENTIRGSAFRGAITVCVGMDISTPEKRFLYDETPHPMAFAIIACNSGEDSYVNCTKSDHPISKFVKRIGNGAVVDFVRDENGGMPYPIARIADRKITEIIK